MVIDLTRRREGAKKIKSQRPAEGRRHHQDGAQAPILSSSRLRAFA
jgi:hypothetical protein